jgi:hypothetical protein
VIGFGASLDPRIVYDAVESTISIVSGIQKVSDAFFVANIQGDCQSLAAAGGNLLDAFCQFVGASGSEYDLGTCAGQYAGKVVTKARRSASNGNHVATEIKRLLHVRIPSVKTFAGESARIKVPMLMQNSCQRGTLVRSYTPEG